jgi:hypothetical protein
MSEESDLTLLHKYALKWTLAMQQYSPSLSTLSSLSLYYPHLTSSLPFNAPSQSHISPLDLAVITSSLHHERELERNSARDSRNRRPPHATGASPQRYTSIGIIVTGVIVNNHQPAGKVPFRRHGRGPDRGSRRCCGGSVGGV